MKKVLIRGPLLTNSGYGIHSRQVFKWLLSRKDIEIKCQILPWGNNPWILSDKYDNGIIKEITKRVIQDKDLLINKFDESYQIQLPNEWIPISDRDFCITAGIESDYCSKQFAKDISKFKNIIVPSNFSKETIQNSFEKYELELKSKINVIPESYPEYFDHIEKSNNKQDINSTEIFNFLVFGQISSLDFKGDRKNTFKTLLCILDTFKEEKNVNIIFKTNIGKNNKKNKKFILDELKKFLKINNLSKENRKCKLYLNYENLNENQLYKLYTENNIKALVSGTRGEGFGLVHLESARLGIPIISTNWSGYKDFLEDRFIKIKYDLVNIDDKFKNKSLISNDSKWAEFCYEDMKKNLINFYENEKKYSKISQDLKNIIKQNYCIDNINKLYNKIL